MRVIAGVTVWIVQRATLFANQMLSLAKVEQLRQRPESAALAFDEVVRQVSLDLSPLIAARDIAFELDTRRSRCTHTCGCCRNSLATCCTMRSRKAAGYRACGAGQGREVGLDARARLPLQSAQQG